MKTMDLETLLRRNYDQIVDVDAMPVVIEFVREKRPIPTDLRTAKRLTKLCWHIMRSEEEVTTRFLTHAYEYAAEALDRDDRQTTMRVHLEAYAGEFSLILARATQKIEWSSRAYNHSLSAAERLERGEPEYAAACYDRAAEAATLAIEQDPKLEIVLLKRAYDANIASAELSPNNSSKAIRYRQAKDCAKKLACLTNQDSWFSKAAAALEGFLQYAKKQDTGRRLRMEAQRSEHSGELTFLRYGSGHGQA